MKKNICIFGTVLISLLFLSGCFPDGKTEQPNGNKSAASSTPSISTSIPSKIKKNVSNNIVLNATVHIPANTLSSTFQAVPLNFDYNQLSDIFLQGKSDIRYEERRHPLTNEIMYRGFLASDTSGVSINYEGISNGLVFGEKIYNDYPYALSMYAYEGWIRPDFREKFPLETLENIDREAAVTLVREKLDALDVPVLDTPEVYCLDLEHLQKDFEANWKDFENPKNPDGRHLEWTKEQEAYVIVYQEALPDGSPIIQKGYMPGVIYNSPIYGSKLVGVVGKEGLIFLNASGTYDIQDQKPLSGPVISLETACDRMAATYDNILVTDPIEIQEIRLEYVPRYINAENYEFEIIPAWVFQGIQETNDEKGGTHTDDVLVLIDAVTGKEIPNEGVF
ncbi:MAG: hypothetical protein ACLSVK_01490 [Acutalibacteraceae bacterium]